MVGTALGILFMAVFFAIIGGIILHRLIGMYIMGEAGPVECVLIIGAYIGMLISIVTLNIILAVVLLVVLIGLLLLPKLQGQRAIRSMYDEDIAHFRTAIESDAQNLAARTRLAETLYKKGDLDEAIMEMAEVVRRSPESRTEAYRLQQYMAEKEERKTPPVTCPSCGQRNPSERMRCYNCESSLSISSELVKWLKLGGARQIVITGAIALAVVTVAMVGLSMIPFIGRIIIVCAFLFLLSIVFLVRMHMNF